MNAKPGPVEQCSRTNCSFFYPKLLFLVKQSKLCLVLMLSKNKTQSGEMKDHGNYKGWRARGD